MLYSDVESGVAPTKWYTIYKNSNNSFHLSLILVTVSIIGFFFWHSYKKNHKIKKTCNTQTSTPGYVFSYKIDEIHGKK